MLFLKITLPKDYSLTQTDTKNNINILIKYIDTFLKAKLCNFGLGEGAPVQI